jgi:MFS family permease
MLAPAAFSLLADTFEPRIRGRAIAVVALSGTIGSGGSFLIGGLVLRAVPGDTLVHLPLLGDRLGWQIAFLAAGAPGLLIAALMLAVREPVRKERALHGAGSAAKGLLRPYVRRHGGMLVGLFFIGALLMMVAYGVAAWMATYFIRRFGLEPSTVGYALGALSIAAGLLGGLSGGAVSDWLGQRRVGGRFDIYLICTLIALPLVATWTFAPLPILGFLLVMATLATTNLAACTTPTVLQEVAPNELRGLMLGSYYVVQGILGPGLGPISVALVTDQVFGDPAAIGLSMPLVMVPLVLAALALSLLLRGAYAATRAEILQTTRQDLLADAVAEAEIVTAKAISPPHRTRYPPREFR